MSSSPPFKPRWKQCPDEVREQMCAEWEIGSWGGYIDCHPEALKLGAFLDVAPFCTDDDYWRILGELWTHKIDRPSRAGGVEKWVEVFQSPRPGRERLMMPNEHDSLAALPDPVTIYRGVCPPPLPAQRMRYRHLSWTVNRGVALDKFARRGGCKGGTLLTASVRKDCILAYFDSKSEYEVLIDPRKVRRIERTPAN